MTANQENARLARIARGSSLLVAALVLAGAIINFLRPIYFEAAIAAVSLLIFIWLQFFANRRKGVRNPPAMQICIAVLTFTSVFVGRFFALYKNLPGFDKSQHFLYGMIFAVCGFVLFYRLNPAARQQRIVSPATMVVFIASFALLCGFGWEIYEFASDRLFNTNMQAWKQGLAHGVTDTMLDLLADLVGGLAVGLTGARRMQRDPQGFFMRYWAGFFTEQTADEPANPAAAGE